MWIVHVEDALSDYTRQTPDWMGVIGVLLNLPDSVQGNVTITWKDEPATCSGYGPEVEHADCTCKQTELCDACRARLLRVPFRWRDQTK